MSKAGGSDILAKFWRKNKGRGFTSRGAGKKYAHRGVLAAQEGRGKNWKALQEMAEKRAKAAAAEPPAEQEIIPDETYQPDEWREAMEMAGWRGI
jgi:hypothetical protein